MKPLRGGIKLDGKKESTLIPWTAVRPEPPKTVRLPLIQGEMPAQPLASVGQRVLVGEKIAESTGKARIGIHASISGKISGINSFIEILSDGKNEAFADVGKERRGWESLAKADIFSILHESGIGISWRDGLKTLVLNACESEPYLTSDHSLLMSHPVEILKGAALLRRIFHAEELVIATEDNKEEVVEVLRSKIFFHSWSGARVEVFPARYPQENEKILMVSLGRKPEETFLLNITSAFAVYEAVALQKPFYERIVTIAGECVAMPRNFWIRFGTSVKDAVKYARGFLRDPAKVILGGPMTGRAVQDLETPVLADTRAVLGLPPEVAKPEAVEPCIRCGRCIEDCPVSISPAMITLAAEKDRFDLAEEYGASFCIECGNCSYVCPSKRPMVELIRYANKRNKSGTPSKSAGFA